MADPIKRLKYFDGEFLRASDFEAEQTYHLGLRRRRTRLTSTHGIAEGLDVVMAAGSTAVTVKAGMAIDGEGRELVLAADRVVDLASQASGAAVWLTIKYGETASDPATSGATGMTRMTEDPVVEPLTNAPPDPTRQIFLAKVTRSGTAVTGIDPSGRPSSEPRQLDGMRQAINGRLGLAGGTIAGSLFVNGSFGVSTTAQNRQFQFEGHEVHSGGAGAGFSFANRGSGFVDSGGTGERWVLYSAGNKARLWSGSDKLTIDSNGCLGVRGLDPIAGIPGGWGGGVHTWDLYAEATICAGSNGAISAYMNSSGQIYAAGDLTLTNGHTIRSNGRMHINTAERLYLLAGGSVWITNDWGSKANLYVGYNGDFPTWSGGGIIAWDVFARGAVYTGSVNANVKKFVIDHPLDPDARELVHASIEGPEAGVYYRGEACLDGEEAIVELPAYFEALTREHGRTVMLTPVVEADGRCRALGASPVVDGRFRVRAADGAAGVQRFYWEVKAIRADLDELVVERQKAPDEALAGAAF